MSVGRIASFLSSLSPSSDTAATSDAVAHHDNVGQTNASQDRERRHQGDDGEIVQQLQTVITAVRVLNENAVQQGAAVAVSSVGTQLKLTVNGLGHLLATLNTKILAQDAERQLRQAEEVMEGVETGLMATQAATQQVFSNLTGHQAFMAREASDRFQAEMKDAVGRVRGVLSQLLT